MSADNITNCERCGGHETVREDWDIGIYNGDFEVQYSAICKECRWKYSHKSIDQNVFMQGTSNID